MSSEAKKRSGLSVRVSGGNRGSPFGEGGSCFTSSSCSSSVSMPCSADIGNIDLASGNFSRHLATTSSRLPPTSLRALSLSGFPCPFPFSRSTLLMAITRGDFDRFRRSINTCTGKSRSKMSVTSKRTSASATAVFTNFIIPSCSLYEGLSAPGVSVYTSWWLSPVTTPRIRCLVVCAFDVTILRRSPTSLFISVDFPTLGDPTILTNPARKQVSGLSSANISWQSTISGRSSACSAPSVLASSCTEALV
mmetsp:Transcript_24276/g.35302  ORF Transcript_24276/g.35302 Transcript_24276/m.35302 type:complete len:250 (-) Transcript_24276:238-987(-)